MLASYSRPPEGTGVLPYSLNFRIAEAVEYLRGLNVTADATVILGSGLNSFVDQYAEKKVIPYSDIPFWPLCTNPDHKGNLVVVKQDNRTIAFFQGRIHYYEGYDGGELTFGVRALAQLGTKKLLTTNAVGGINRRLQPGDYVLWDNFNMLFSQNIYHQVRDSFLDKSVIQKFAREEVNWLKVVPDLYDKEINQNILNDCWQNGIRVITGTHGLTVGPQFETPAEVRALQDLGADCVGMSSVPEVLGAFGSGYDRIISISLITNLASGLSATTLSDLEVLEVAKENRQQFEKVMEICLSSLLS
jgi:purine-nucleoside phosphorylase